ncbi:DUF6551 family protein [Nocardia terpenica]|uniref:ParB/Sulfiredoxin domain-containing protein n=1 Tax=Nocardia terpenica TaxID=455432 RepID=A0A164HF18_9NOCA|nr:DUF6551 family protein [Nocardia terpenica]KZM68458.1 hypothetical protein AWN90_11345 [Nocardia terpenica]NQE88595.1 hypothetical protein [Nocardia terpenica]
MMRHKTTELIDPAELTVNQSTQRPLNEGFARKIANDFNPDAFGRPVVSYRNGKKYILDAQHRVAAYRMSGRTADIECDVYYGLTEAEEAELFLSLNTKKAPQLVAKFKVGVTAGQSPEVEISETLARHGLTVGNGRARGRISQVAALYRMEKRGGVAHMDDVLGVYREAFGSDAFDSVVLDGLSLFLTRYGNEIDPFRLIDRLLQERGGIHGLMQGARRMKDSHGIGKADAMAASIVRVYNKGRGGKKVADWLLNTNF